MQFEPADASIGCSASWGDELHLDLVDVVMRHSKLL